MNCWRTSRTTLLLLLTVAALGGPGAAPLGAAQQVDAQAACMRVGPAQVDPRAEAGHPDASNVELDGSVVVSPTSVDIAAATSQPLAPGARDVWCTITVRNRNPVAVTYDLVPVGVRGSRSDERPVDFVEAGEDGFTGTAATWLEPSTPSITIEPRGVMRVPVHLSVPGDAAGGGHYGGVAVRPRPADADRSASSNLGIQSEIVVPFLLEVAGGSRRSLALRGSTAPRLVWNRARWRYEAQIENTGNVHTIPRGRIRIRSIFGSTVASLPIEGRTLLPGARAPADLTWRGAPWFGIYRVDVRITPDGQRGPIERDSRWLVALPPWWLVLIVSLVLLLVFGGSWIRRRYERHWAEQHPDIDDEDAHIELGPI